MDAKKIGRNIRTVRMERKLTQEQLSWKVGITSKYLSNIECGAKIPKFETFVSIANALNIDANTLLSDELTAMTQVECGQLWEKISKLPPQRQKNVLKMVELMLENET